MADLRKICDAIASGIETIPGNSASVIWEQIQTPVSVVEPRSIDYTNAMRGGSKIDLVVRVLLSNAVEGDSKELRFDFFGGANDFKDAIETSVPLNSGEVAQSVFVRSAENFGIWDIGGISYIGGEFSLDVYA